MSSINMGRDGRSVSDAAPGGGVDLPRLAVSLGAWL